MTTARLSASVAAVNDGQRTQNRPKRLRSVYCDLRKWRAVVSCFGDQYKQWNAAFDAGYCAALDKPYITLHGEDIVHPLKEVDAAQAWWTTTDQAVEILRYVLKA